MPVKLTVNRRSSPPPPRLGEGITIANRFRLTRQIGEGGMGTVWLATHLGLGIPCAVKFVEGEWRRQPEMVARFEREAKVEAQLRSPHVVHVLDHGVWNGTPYIAMELLQGESVADRLDRVGRLDLAATHRLVAHIARALTRAHAIGIVHRDLKPDNVYLVPDDDGEIAKVLDFGVAKWTSDWAVNSVTKTGLLVGTPLYMSPEQARGTKEIDFRADLWSLAVMTFQCMTGELPFLSEGLGDLLAKIMFEPIPVPSSIVSDLPTGFDAWWARASSRDIDARFQSAKELADELAVALGITGASTVAAAPPGLREAMLSDYNSSVGDGVAVSQDEPRGRLTRVWPRTPTGMLLGIGAVGVALIAATMSFQRGRDDKKTGQTLVTPSVTTQSAVEPPPTVEAKPRSTVAPTPEPMPTPAKASSDREPPQKADRDEPKKGRIAPPPPRPREKAPPGSSRPKNVDFGI